MLGQCRLVALDLLDEPGDPAVGLELGEGRFEQVACGGAAHLSHQVDGHVVRRPERRTQRIGARGCEPGDPRRVDVRAPQHDRVPLDVDPSPPRPPGQLGVLTGRDVSVRLAVELREPFEQNGSRGHVDAERQRLGGEDRAHQTTDEQVLDGLLERRDHAGVMRRDAATQPIPPVPVTEHLEVLSRDSRGSFVDHRVDPVPLVLGRQPQPCVHALPHRGIAPRAAEDEGDARQQALAVQAGDDVGTVRRPPTAQRAAATSARGAGAEVAHPPVDVALQVGVDRRAVGAEEVEQPRLHEQVLPQRNRTLLVHDHRGLAAHRDQPVAELLGVGHRCRERHEPH